MTSERKRGSEYFTCPYCAEHRKGHSKRVPKNVGTFRIKVVNSYLLIMQCQRCSKVHRITWVGSQIIWEDMADVEKKAFSKHPNYPYG